MSLEGIFHVIHLTDDLDLTERWYGDLLAPVEFLPRHRLDAERRDASIGVVADLAFEPLAPAFDLDDWQATAIGRSFQRSGPSWHSLAWYVTDTTEIWRRFSQAGLRLFGMRGALTEPPDPADTLFTHPKETGAALQFTPSATTRYAGLDPRRRPDFDPDVWRGQGPGVVGLSYITLICPDVDAALDVWTGVLGGELIGRGTSGLTQTHDGWVRMGEAVVRLSAPVGDRSPAAEHLTTRGPGVHAVTLEVKDLDACEHVLREANIAVQSRDVDTLFTEPADTRGVVFGWASACGAPA